MKPRKTTQNFAAMMLLLALGAQAPSVLAQDDLLSDTDSVLNSEQIDVDGSYAEKPRETAADRIGKLRKKLEDQNEQMVQSKIEGIRMREEQKLAKKLQKAFRGGLQNLNNVDQVSTTQAAPQKVVAPIVVPPKKKERNIKVIPTAGLLNFNGDSVDFDADINTGVSIENMVHPRFSVGVGFAYTTMKITDVADQLSNQYNNSNGSVYWDAYSQQYVQAYQGYQNTYGQGREMSYKRLGVELNSKFFFTVGTTIRPYVGAAIGYNKTTLVYEDNQAYNYNSYSFGDEEFTSNYVSGSALLGAEVNFTETVGMNLDFRYSAGLTDGSGSGGSAGYTQPDQVKLDNIGGRVKDADQMSLNAGLVIKF